MTDHQRWDTVYPFSKAKTPNFDELAKRSAVFTNAYCTAPHCCPSRASFFSGLYPSEHGIWNNVDVGNTLSKGLNQGIRLFPEILKENGYKCMLSGKWHLSSLEGPLDRGFDEAMNFGIKYGRKRGQLPDYEWDLYYKSNKYEKICDGTETRGDGQIIRRGYPIYTQYGSSENPFGDGTVAENAVEMIKNHRTDSDSPLFMFAGVLGPHDPYIVPEKFEKMYDINEINLPDNFYDKMEDKPNLYKRTKEMFSNLSEKEHKKSILKYLAFCSYEDYLFGEIIKEAQKLQGRTIIMYVSDHGDYMGEHGLWAKGLPCFDGAYHIPLMMYDSANENAILIDEFVTLADIAPTILEICEINSDIKFSGNSLVPYINGDFSKIINEYVFTQSNGNELYGIQRSVKDREHKLVYNGFDYDEFYDLKEDPGELKNEINNPRYEKEIEKMYYHLWEFAYKRKDNCINPYIMVGLAKHGPGIVFEK